MPPTPEMVEKFENDKSPNAYEKLVAMEIDKLNVLFNELSQQEEEADGSAIAFG